MLSDVHGNAFALEAVLADMARAAPDAIINLGDQVEGFADPARAYALQAALGAVEVRGNNEEKWWPKGRRTPLSREVGRWLRTQLSEGAIARLAALPLQVRLGEVLAFHGAPHSAWESLLWAWDAGAGEYRSSDPRLLRETLAPLRAEVLLCGHTHRAGVTRVGDTLLVNCGSVSDQVDGDPRARWTLLERRGGHWSAELRAVSYDVTAAVNWARAHSPFGEVAASLLDTGQMTRRGTH